MGPACSGSAMEASQSLSIDSFSYSWLVNLKPALENPDNSFRASFDASDDVSVAEKDPKTPPSKRFFEKSEDFKFDFPVSPSALDFVHADQLISNGYLMPLFFDPFTVKTLEESEFVRDRCNSSHAADKDSDCSWLSKCRKLMKQELQKYLNVLIPLWSRLSGVGTSSKAVKSLKRVYSSETSPITSGAWPLNHRRQSSDSERSIYEAVLHCKRSIGK